MIDKFIKDNIKFQNEKNEYLIKCPICSAFFKSFVHPPHSISDIIRHIKFNVTNFQTHGCTLMICCPFCDKPSAIDFRKFL